MLGVSELSVAAAVELAKVDPTGEVGVVTPSIGLVGVFRFPFSVVLGVVVIVPSLPTLSESFSGELDSFGSTVMACSDVGPKASSGSTTRVGS